MGKLGEEAGMKNRKKNEVDSKENAGLRHIITL